MDDLVKYRLDSSKERLESAQILLDAGKYKDSIGRSYYAIFTAVKSVLAKDRIDFAKHAGVISYFQKEYVKTGVFDKKYSKYLQEAFQIRNNCDYDDFYIVAKADAEEQLIRAREYYDTIYEYLKNL
ncbi:MAG: HEPN domain-containing protein [Selenomonadaceae bacterium]|nr:HEPN domain-containing protein [Selenomonadaceae bacterium]